ncbi:hypothetical protein BH20ACI3_BH20ACI3_34580 [soil metagenome]
MAGPPAEAQGKRQYTMLGKPRVNNLDGGGLDKAEKDLRTVFSPRTRASA